MKLDHVPTTSRAREQSKQPQQHEHVRVLVEQLKVCSSTRNLQRGKEFHAEAIRTGNDCCIYVATALVNMYSKCQSMREARQVFDSIRNPDLVMWNALILGYAENGEGVTALDLFAQMTYAADTFTFVAILKACTSLVLEESSSSKAACLARGKLIHSAIGHRSNSHVENSLVDMYAKCGRMLEARQVFDRMKRPDIVSWNSLMMGYAENGEGFIALDLLEKMRSRGFAPDSITFVAALKACSSLALLEGSKQPELKQELKERGKQLHLQIGCDPNIFVHNSLIDMYANCGSMTEARQVFDRIKHPTTVSWTALILGYAENGDGVTALDMFARMRSQGCAPDYIAYIAAIKTCSLVGALETGRKIHAEIRSGTSGTKQNVMLVTSLVDLYAKCGSLEEAQSVFDSHPGTRDRTTWTALLAGYSRLGDHEAVFRLVKVMQDAGVQPENITFLCVLVCCNHAGLVDKAQEFFELMTRSCGIAPDVEHCNCMVDVLGRSQKLDDAMAFLRGMACIPNVITWMAVLGACGKWKNAGVGTLAFTTLVSLDGTNAPAHVLMANVYGSRGMWEEQQMVLRMRRKLDRQSKQLGQSCWTSELGEVHGFGS